MDINIDFDTITENVLLSLFLVIAVYTYFDAESFSGQVAQFPQLLSIIIIVGAILLLLRNYLPASLYKVVAESNSLVDRPDDPEEMVIEEAEVVGVDTNDKGDRNENGVTDPIEKLKSDSSVHDMLFTAGLTTAYVIFSYLFSMFIASPLFILAYGYKFDVSRKVIIGLAIASIVVVWAFATILYLPLDEGVFVDGVVR